MDSSQGEKTTMDRETMDPSQGEKTTDREILEPSEGEKTIDLIQKAKGFLQNYFSTWAELAENRRAELVEKRWAELVNLYREDSWMNFDGEIIQGKEAIRAKLTSLQPRFYEVLSIKCLSDSGTGFSSGLHGVVGGNIWLDGKQDDRPFSQMFVLLPTPEGSFDISHGIHSILFTGPES